MSLLLPTPLPLQLPKWLIALFIGLSFIGFLDATYLTVEHYTESIPPCYIFQGCDEVTTSRYATVAGIPIALGGAVYYLILFLAAVAYADTKRPLLLKLLVYLPIVGFLVSLGLVYLQLFVIKAICLYCVLSAISSTLLFILSLRLIFLNRK